MKIFPNLEIDGYIRRCDDMGDHLKDIIAEKFEERGKLYALNLWLYRNRMNSLFRASFGWIFHIRGEGRVVWVITLLIRSSKQGNCTTQV